MIVKVCVFVMLLYVSCGWSACITPTNQDQINSLFSTGGANTIVSLCASIVVQLTSPVIFTATNQELSTAGYPTGSTRATLVVTGSTQSVAIQGQYSGIKIRNIQVNGNRPTLGRVDGGDALLALGGGVTNQLIDNIHAYEPRGWSCIHVIEGGCTGANITNSQFGPSGTSDGHWADGISYACQNGLVKGNTITDATDGAIVVFGAPGTLVTGNTIIASTRVLLGGINMVDYAPYNGNYRSTVVSNNVINAQGVQIKVGIAIGPIVWGGSQINSHGVVTGNTLSGQYMGYGIAVAGVNNFTIQNNVVNNVRQVGVIGTRCYNPPNIAIPYIPFAYDPSTTTQSSLQSNFIAGNIHYSICIDPGYDVQYIYYSGQLSIKSDNPIQLNGSYWLLQSDGNLVVYNNSNYPLWASGTFSSCTGNACTFRFTAAGALELVNSTSTYYSWTPTLIPGGSITLRNSQPFMQFKDAQGNVQFSTQYFFYAGFSLSKGQYVRQGSLYLTLTSTANAVVYSGSIGGPVLWTTGVTGQTCTNNCLFVFQGDGNLVLYNNGTPYFASGTSQPNATLKFNSAAPYLTMVSTSGTVLWHST